MPIAWTALVMPTGCGKSVWEANSSDDHLKKLQDLHAYSNYYAEACWARALSVCRHVVGWWLVSVFIASAAIL